jgi:transcriptional regulator
VYIPPSFKEDRIEVLHQAIRNTGLVTLVTLTEDGLIASHGPMLLEADPAPYGRLIGHLARPNPQTRGALGEALAICQGPDGYITPSWYATKQRTGKVVPTWNYVTVHAYGPVTFFAERERLRELVTRLTTRHEAPRAKPWAVTDAPADFLDSMLTAIIGFELPIRRLEGKWKMSQNRPADDRAGVLEGLQAEGREDLAQLISR